VTTGVSTTQQHFCATFYATSQGAARQQTGRTPQSNNLLVIDKPHHSYFGWKVAATFVDGMNSIHPTNKFTFFVGWHALGIQRSDGQCGQFVLG
jgi:hypothetical protein